MRIKGLFKSSQNKSIYQYLFKSSMITLFVQGVAVLLLFGINYFIEDNFGTKTLGVYAKVVFWINLLATIGLFGYDDLINKYWNTFKSNVDKRSLLLYSFKGVVISSVVIVIVFYVIVNYISFNGLSSLKGLYPYFLSAIPFFSLLLLIQVVLKAERKIVFSLLGESLIKPFVFLIALIFISSILQLVVLNSLVIILCFLMMIFFIKPFLKTNGFTNVVRTKNNDKDDWRNVLVFFILLQIGGSLFDKLDMISVSLNIGDEQMAYFSIVSKIVVLLSFPMTIVNSINAPMYNKFNFNNDLKGLEVYYQKSSQGVFLSTLLFGVLLLVLGYYVLLSFGESYLNFYPLLIIMILDRVLRSIFGSISYLLTMIGYERLVSKLMILFLFIGSISVWLSTIYYGVYGAVISYAITRLLYLFTLFVLAKEKLKLSFWIFK